ncbi:MAG: chromosome condensation regulator RCC1 [Gemmatimonadota bacterium]|nr:MAG: chromosome condensation regulator RCC1 [Gemmatimonadota bacterium]
MPLSRNCLAIALGAGAILNFAGCDGNTTGPARGPAFTSVIVGENHSCALAEDGIAFCWGFNISGQLGDGANVNRDRPVRVAGDQRFASLTGGINHTCGITAGGVLYCWGRNSEGQLGDGTTQDRSVPVRVNTGLRFDAVAGGGLHTCGLASGRAYCWGSGSSGQLGNSESGVRTLYTAPVPVSGNLGFVSLSALGSHTCGITVDGTAYCWGSDAAGTLGTLASETCPDGLSNLLPCSAVPVPVVFPLAFTAVSAGVAHTCALAINGAAYCWGRNLLGQLGDGTNLSSPVPRPVSGGLQLVHIRVGNSHSCGLTAAGSAYCWGGNHRGQLGNGSTLDASEPAPVSGGIDFVELSVGGAHTCGRDSAGLVYCWGQNGDGELGYEPPDLCSDVPCSHTPNPVRVDPALLPSRAPGR